MMAMENTILYSSGNAGGTYLYSVCYNNYIENKIKNEEALARQINQFIPINEAAYRNVRVMTEAKLSDKLKSKMQKVVQFIKNLIGKFMESMTNILLDEKEYLEKYKDIILNKRPKDSMEYSYNGDYDTAINRCINTTVPIFNYAAHAEALKKEGDGAIVNVIMNGKTGFTYDEGEDSLATQFKEYFLATETDKQSSGKFSELNFREMYNFCYNFKKIENITKKDINYITQCTNAIVNAANQQIKDNADDKPTQSDQPASSEEESFVFAHGKYFTEDKTNDGQQNGQGGQQKEGDNKPKTSDLEIKDNSKNTNAVSQMGSTTDDTHTKLSDDATKTNAGDAASKETENDMITMGDKYTRVCTTLIAAKCTAVQQIAKDYMNIIRAHVRSYIGNEDDKKDNRVTQQSRDYKKDNQNQQQTQGNTNEPSTENAQPQRTINDVNSELLAAQEKLRENKFKNWKEKDETKDLIKRLQNERSKLLSSNK